jgi:hypothetical protein
MHGFITYDKERDQTQIQCGQVTCSATAILYGSENSPISMLLRDGWTCGLDSASKRRLWKCPVCSGVSWPKPGPGDEISGDGYTKYTPEGAIDWSKHAIQFPGPIIDQEASPPPKIELHTEDPDAHDALGAVADFNQILKDHIWTPDQQHMRIDHSDFKFCKYLGCCSLLMKSLPPACCHFCLEHGPKKFPEGPGDFHIENPASRGVYAGVAKSTIFTFIRNDFALFLQLCEGNRGFTATKKISSNELVELTQIPPAI